MAGAAVRAVHPYLQDGALQGSGSPQVDQLEAEAGQVIADGNEERVDRHWSGKKMWGTSPTSAVGPYWRPRDSEEKLASSAPSVNAEMRAQRSGCIPRYATIRPSRPPEARWL